MAGVALQITYVMICFSAQAALVITYAQGVDCMGEHDVLTDG